MATKLVVTIDTEPDNQWNADLRKNPTFNNIYEIYRLQKIFDKFKTKPTYLVSYSVIKCGAVSGLKDIARSVPCEIGTHLHSWETPPIF